MKTLEITNTDEFMAIQLVADFGTLLGTYSRGFAVIIEPYDERLPHIPDPVLQLRYQDDDVNNDNAGDVNSRLVFYITALMYQQQ